MFPRSQFLTRIAVWVFLAVACGTEIRGASITREQLKQEIRATAERHEKGQHPMDTATVLSIYASHENLVTRAEIAHLYEEAYVAAKQRNAPSLLARLAPKAGWIVAIITIVWTLFRSQLEKVGGVIVDRLFEAIRRQFAGLRYIRNANIRRYCASLIERYSKLKVPFIRRELVLQDIYVPLRVAAARTDASDIDAHEALRKYRRLVITGNAGAGKTVLLSYIALSFARTGRSDVAENVVPLLFPLNRIRDAHEKPLREHLAEELTRCGMPRANEFLTDSMRTGRLMLLLDGLDEVSRERRSQIVESITDFVEQADRNCRVIVTCRAAVYNNDFFGWADEHLVISDFVDYQIISFLQPWKPVMPSGRTIEHLIETLHDRPRILALARNPLQLTMISSLYAEEYEAFTLPHSRTEFYERSTQLFLDRWHQERNRYSKPDKTAVLEHLGLHLHVTGGTSSKNSDKRSLPREVVIAEINKVLPRLNLDPAKDCQLVLDEIVDRSGLLMRIDSGERFQFAHLTIQEYYAAQALAQTSNLLLTYYRNDSQHWREVLRLWCGFDHDCSALVTEIFSFDPIMALECVADAQRISDEVATTVTTYFQENLEEQIISTHANVREAYAAVASSPRPRGQAMLEFLSASLTDSRATDTLRQAIAETLAATNLSSAAAILFGARQMHYALTTALTSMGDLAVIALSPLVKEGNIAAINDLFTIGTPNAAITLVPRLWDDRETVANSAAWALASLLTRREVKQALSSYPLTSHMMASPQDAWVWAPFARPEDGSLRFVVGQISKHLTTADSAPGFVHRRPLEPRLTTAVAFVARREETLRIMRNSGAWTTTTLARLRQVLGISSDREIASSVEKTLKGEISSRTADEVWEAILRDVPVKSAVGCMLHSLPINLISEISSRVMRAGAFELKEEWRRMHQPPPKRWWSRAIPPVGAVALMILLLPSFLLLIPTIWVQTSGWSWQRIVTVVVAILVLPGCAAWIFPVVKYRELLEQAGWLRKNTLLPRAGRACIFLLGPLLAVFSFVIGTLITAVSRTDNAVGMQLFSLSCTLLCAPALLAALLAAFSIGGLSWITWSAAYFLVMGILAFLGDWKSSLEAKISNPLRGVRF